MQIYDMVDVAKIMKTALVLPSLDHTSYWADERSVINWHRASCFFLLVFCSIKYVSYVAVDSRTYLTGSTLCKHWRMILTQWIHYLLDLQKSSPLERSRSLGQRYDFGNVLTFFLAELHDLLMLSGLIDFLQVNYYKSEVLPLLKQHKVITSPTLTHGLQIMDFQVPYGNLDVG